MQASCNPKHFERNVFIQWLRSVLGQELADQTASRYRIGSCKAGPDWAVFWQIDAAGNVRTAKQMRYGPDGRRFKGEGLSTLFAFKTSDGYRPCLFGEHLLSEDERRPVALVESEKTAILAAAHYPQLVWIGTGGSQFLTATKAQPLRNRPVLIIPDADDAGQIGAQKAHETLRDMGISARIVDILPNVDDGTDLADVLAVLGEQPAQIVTAEPEPQPQPKNPAAGLIWRLEDTHRRAGRPDRLHSGDWPGTLDELDELAAAGYISRLDLGPGTEFNVHVDVLPAFHRWRQENRDQIKVREIEIMTTKNPSLSGLIARFDAVSV